MRRAKPNVRTVELGHRWAGCPHCNDVVPAWLSTCWECFGPIAQPWRHRVRSAIFLHWLFFHDARATFGLRTAVRWIFTGRRA